MGGVANVRLTAPVHDLVGGSKLRGRAAGVAILSAAGIGVSFVAQTILARVSGPRQFGIYTYVITWMSVLALLSKLGLDPALLPVGGQHLDSGRRDAFRRMVRQSSVIVVATGIGAALLTVAVVRLFSYRTSLLGPFVIAAATVPFFSWLQVSRVYFSCLRRQVAAVVTINLVKNAAMLGGLAVWLVIRKSGDLSAFYALLILLLAVLFSDAVCVWLLREHISRSSITGARQGVVGGRGRVTRRSHRRIWKRWWVTWSSGTVNGDGPRVWLATGAPLLFVAAAQFLLGRADVLVLGASRNVGDVGIYGAAVLLTTPLELLLASISYVIGPELTECHRKCRVVEMQRLLSRSTEILMFLAVPYVAILVVEGHRILGLLGQSYAEAYVPLVLLAVAQLIGLLTGSSGYTLSLTGNGRALAFVMVPVGIIVMATYVALIPRWGPVGAGWATLSTMAMREIVVTVVVARKVGVVPLPFGDRLRSLAS